MEQHTVSAWPLIIVMALALPLMGWWFWKCLCAIKGEPNKESPPCIVKCKWCGDKYHRAWGGICPNCSGAD